MKKKADPCVFFLSKLCPFLELCPFKRTRMKSCQHNNLKKYLTMPGLEETWSADRG